MKVPSTLDASARSPTLMSVIGRAHLDKAHDEGQAAGNDPDKSAADCPYDSRANLLTIKAWEQGFYAARLHSDGRA
jgi:hypothetical protein